MVKEAKGKVKRPKGIHKMVNPLGDKGVIKANPGNGMKNVIFVVPFQALSGTTTSKSVGQSLKYIHGILHCSM